MQRECGNEGLLAEAREMRYESCAEGMGGREKLQRHDVLADCTSKSMVLSWVRRSDNKLETNLHRGDQSYHPSCLFHASNLEAKLRSSAVWLRRVRVTTCKGEDLPIDSRELVSGICLAVVNER